MANLYALTGNYAALVSQLDECETQEELDAVMEALESVSDDIGEKAEAYARIKRNYEAEADALATEIKRLQARKKSAENNAERMKNAMLLAMKTLGAKKLNTTIGSWSVRLNPWSVNVVDANAVPDEFKIPQEPAIDRKAITQHFKQTGELIDGVEMLQTESVMFR